MACGAFEVVLRETDGAIFVDCPSDFWPDVGIGDRLGAGGEQLGVRERLHPHFPIFAAHDRNGIGDFLFAGGLDRDGADDALVGVDGLVGIGGTDGFETGFVDDAGGRVSAAGRGEGVDDEIDLAEVGADGVEGLLFNVGGESIAVEIFGVESGGASGFGEGDGVIPAGRGGSALLRRTLEKDPERGRAGAEGRSDPGGQAVAGGGTEYEDALGAARDGALGLHVVDPLLNMRGTALGMGSDANEAANLGFNNHAPQRFRGVGAESKRGVAAGQLRQKQGVWSATARRLDEGKGGGG